MEEQIISKSVNGWDYQNTDRIFYKEGYYYDYAVKATDVWVEKDYVSVEIGLISGNKGLLRFSKTNEKNLFFEFKTMESAFEMKPFYLTEKSAQRGALSLTVENDSFVLSIGKLIININKEPFQLEVINGKKAVFSTSIKKISRQYVTPGLGHRIDANGCREAFISWNIANGEKFYGLGEKFSSVEKSATRTTSYAMDACATNTTDLAYKAHPILLSTNGYGLLLTTAKRTHWDIGDFCFVSGTVLVEGPVLRGHIFIGEKLKDLIAEETELQGRSEMVEPWTLGVWYSRCAYMNKKELYGVKDKLRELELPFDVLNIDVHWGKNYWYKKFWVDCCDFEWGEDKFPKPTEMFAELMKQNVACSLWINPYLPPGTAVYKEAMEKDYLVKTTEGGLAHIKRRQVSEIGIPDLTNPEAYMWWKEKVKGLLRLGIRVLKPDYTDRIPEDALFFNGYTGKDMHNAYIYLYIKACYDATQEVHGTSLVWKRPGFLGTGKFAGTWSGDVESSFEGLKYTIRGGLSVGFTGESYWSSDIAGFKGERPNPELYIRWSQIGLLCSLARYHGTSEREPWFYGEQAVNIVREYSQLRYSLVPYILEMAVQAEDKGLPIMRHLAIEFQKDAFVHAIDDEFLLGEDILVVPILEEGMTKRDVYLPEGTWFDLKTGEKYAGRSTITVDVTLEDIPIFIRGGAVIPQFKAKLQHLKDFETEAIEICVYGKAKKMQGTLVSQNRVRYTYTILENGSIATDYPGNVTLRQMYEA
ncbi:glycoside hydrolase family 31 protein [Listeria welshimeri]|uniref:glycoside hydrolase family 31 protein n=1 Tax=Listeria welshimeri TaxID=1643 RepID=UPI001E2AC0D2|nr:alpha-xylosidase [Listeria welshimeri]